MVNVAETTLGEEFLTRLSIGWYKLNNHEITSYLKNLKYGQKSYY